MSVSKTTKPVQGREATAGKLLKSSAKHSFDPEVDVDWAAPLLDEVFFVPEHLSSLYGTDMWERMTRAQRIELTRCELANLYGFGIWVETLFMQMLARHSLAFDPTSDHLRYALTELGDETRHSTMFSRVLATLDRGPYTYNIVDRTLTDVLRAFSTEPLAFVAVLFVEEIFDALQRAGMGDETIQPLTQQTFRIHVVEEARHMSYARDELRRIIPRLSRPSREALAVAVAIGVGLVERCWRTPAMYAQAGLDPAAASAAAKTNPRWRGLLQSCVDRFLPFYAELGLLTPAAKLIWRRHGYTV